MDNIKLVLLAVIDYIIDGVCALVFAMFVGAKHLISQILSKTILKSLVCVVILYFVVINYVFLLERKNQTEELKNEYEYWYSKVKTKQNEDLEDQYDSVMGKIDGIKND